MKSPSEEGVPNNIIRYENPPSIPSSSSSSIFQ
jgi:hypothetical protein